MLFGLEKSIWVFYHFSKQGWKIKDEKFPTSAFCSWFESSEFKYKYFSHAFASLQFLYFGKDSWHLYWLNSYYKSHGFHQTKFPRKASPLSAAALEKEPMTQNNKVLSLFWKLFLNWKKCLESTKENNGIMFQVLRGNHCIKQDVLDNPSMHSINNFTYNSEIYYNINKKYI